MTWLGFYFIQIIKCGMHENVILHAQLEFAYEENLQIILYNGAWSTITMLGKIFSRRQIDIFVFFFSSENGF